MEIQQTSSNGLKFIINEEGMVLKPYFDSVGIPTIGVGCTFYENGTKVRITDPAITPARATALFKNLLRIFELQVYSSTRDDINQNQFDSNASICFNIGVNAYKNSTLVRRINTDPNAANIRDAFQMWSKAGGKPILLARRNREADLYYTPVTQAEATKNELYMLKPDLMYDEHIKKIQSVLGVKIDGWYGPKTAAAVRLFQQKSKILADGVAGPRTLELLNLE